MTKRSGRLLSVSLRGLLLIVFVFGAASGWIGSQRLKSQKQTAAIAALSELDETWRRDEFFRDFRSYDGTFIVYDSGPAEQRKSRGQWLPSWVRRITGEECFHRVVRVNLSRRRIVAADLSPLAVLNSLESLNLDGTEVGDDVASYLAPLKRLRHLCLGDTKITGPGLSKLRTMPNLQELELWDNDVDDNSVACLAEFTHLKRINLCKTRVTAQGISSLQRALPKCRIWWDGTEAFRLINKSPQPLSLSNPNPASTIRAVNYLVSLGNEEAVETLREYVRIAPQESFTGVSSYDQQRLCLIIPLLLQRSQSQQKVPNSPDPFSRFLAKNGVPQAKETYADEWPLFNVVVEGDIPFFMSVGSGRSGPPFPKRDYLVEWAAANCSFRTVPLHPVDDPFAAADRVAEKSGEAGKILPDWCRSVLREQAKRMTAHLGPGEPTQIKTRWSEELQQYVEL